MANFWETKSLFDMSHQEWESICDGCAKCCLVQLQDEETDQLVFTNVACDLLDQKTCQCTSYADRSEKVPTCMTMNIENVEKCAEFAPSSCSYRLLLEGKPLPDWHHLISGDRSLVHSQNKSVSNKVVKALDVDLNNIEEYVVDWVESS